MPSACRIISLLMFVPAVLGEFVYSATGESLTTAVALADPYARDVTLERGFLALPRLGGVLTDQHLQEQDRIGRTDALRTRPAADAAPC